MSRVVVCGSLNMDIVVQSERRPAKGETVLGATVTFLPGEKVSIRRLPQHVSANSTAMYGRGGNRFLRRQPAFLSCRERCR